MTIHAMRHKVWLSIAIISMHWGWYKVANICRRHIDGLYNEYAMPWKRFRYYWPFMRGIHQPAVDSRHKEPAIRSFDILWCVTKYTVEQTFELSIIWDAIRITWRHRNEIDVTPLLTHGSYVPFALNHLYSNEICWMKFTALRFKLHWNMFLVI